MADKEVGHFAIPCDDPGAISQALDTQGVWHNAHFVVRQPYSCACVVVKQKGLTALLKLLGLGPTDVQDAGATEHPDCHLLVPKGHAASRSLGSWADDIDRRIEEIQIKSGQAPQKSVPQKQAPKSARELFLVVTADHAVDERKRETVAALQLVHELHGKCLADGVKSRELFSRSDVLIAAQSVAQDRIAIEGTALAAMGVRFASNKAVLGFAFDTPKGERRLLISPTTEPRVTDADGTINDLPADIFRALVGFVARQEFGNAVTLLIGFFEAEEVADKPSSGLIDMRPFVQVLCSALMAERQSILRHAEEAHVAHEAYHDRLMVAVRQYRDRAHELARVMSEAATVREYREREFDTMAALPLVLKVTADHGWLVVRTQPITVEFDDPEERVLARYTVGRWIVRINLEDCAVRVLPADGQTRDGTMLHPHVYAADTPTANAKANEVCWGALLTAAQTAVREREYKVLLEYVLLLLGSCNPKDPLSVRALRDIGTRLP